VKSPDVLSETLIVIQFQAHNVHLQTLVFSPTWSSKQLGL